MCGIAGSYGYHADAPAAGPDELTRMLARMAARGPDGHGEWHSDDGRVALGHRRLAIIDLSTAGAQPMATVGAEFVVTFNGELYNYRALRSELEAKGHRFSSHSDTEVLLHGYREWGRGLVDRLRGMYAFALHDEARQGLWLVRDPYGIKPLYYSDDGRVLRFASQVKALLAGGRITAATDSAGIAGFYLFGSIPEPFTLYRNVRALPAGHALWVDRRGLHGPRAHTSLAEILCNAAGECAAPSAEALLARFRAALTDSVEHHRVADVPVGLFLSGGVDSGALAGLLRDAGANRLQALTLAFDEFRGTPDDECARAAVVARLYGLQHVVRTVRETEFRDDLGRIFDAMDQPSIDGINTWFIAKAAREAGLKVAISGLGGDELFGSYPSFRDVPAWVQHCRRLPGHGVLGRVLRRAAARIVPRLPARRFAARLRSPKAWSVIEYGGTYPGAYLVRRGLFMPWELPLLMGPDEARAGLARLQPLAHVAAALAPDPGTPYARIVLLESSLYMRNQLLRDCDWAGMAHSVEIRLPLVDIDVFRQAAPWVMDHERLPLGKELLARCPKHPLPSAITRCGKTGFQTPVGTWLQRLSGWSAGDNRFAHRPGEHWSRGWTRVCMAQALPVV